VKKIIYGAGYSEQIKGVTESLQIIDLKQRELVVSVRRKNGSPWPSRKSTINQSDFKTLKEIENLEIAPKLRRLYRDLGATWIEFVRVVRKSAGGNQVYNYLGGVFLTHLGIVRPIGVISPISNDLELNLQELITIAGSINGIDYQNAINCDYMSLDSFSSGVILHELIGHYSEADVANRQRGGAVSALNSMVIKDIPLPGQRIDDQGNVTHAQNLKYGRLGSESGNVFAGVSQVDEHIVFQDRQRHLIAKKKGENSNAKPINTVIVSGKAVPSSNLVILIVSFFNNTGLYKIVIPITEIISITPQAGTEHTYSTICQKNHVPTPFEISSPSMIVRLAGNIRDFIVGKVE
jgi:hypothetical protein